jgi:hypothetical protein
LEITAAKRKTTGSTTNHHMKFLNETMDILNETMDTMDRYYESKGYYLVMDHAPIHQSKGTESAIIERVYRCISTILS